MDDICPCHDGRFVYKLIRQEKASWRNCQPRDDLFCKLLILLEHLCGTHVFLYSLPLLKDLHTRPLLHTSLLPSFLQVSAKPSLEVLPKLLSTGRDQLGPFSAWLLSVPHVPGSGLRQAERGALAVLRELRTSCCPTPAGGLADQHGVQVESTWQNTDHP